MLCLIAPAELGIDPDDQVLLLVFLYSRCRSYKVLTPQVEYRSLIVTCPRRSLCFKLSECCA